MLQISCHGSSSCQATLHSSCPAGNFHHRNTHKRWQVCLRWSTESPRAQCRGSWNDRSVCKSSCTIAQPVAVLLKRHWVLVLLQFSYMGNSFSLAALQMYYHGFYHISRTIGIGTVQLRSYAFVCVCLLLQTGSTGFL